MLKPLQSVWSGRVWPMTMLYAYSAMPCYACTYICMSVKPTAIRLSVDCLANFVKCVTCVYILTVILVRLSNLPMSIWRIWLIFPMAYLLIYATYVMFK